MLKEIRTAATSSSSLTDAHVGREPVLLKARSMQRGILPMLARGELQTIGATTLDEYRKYVEKDAALERRFQRSR